MHEKITDPQERRADHVAVASAQLYRIETIEEEIAIAKRALQAVLYEHGQRRAMVAAGASLECVAAIAGSISRQVDECLARTAE